MTVTILIRVLVAIASLVVLVAPGLLTTGSSPSGARPQPDEQVTASPVPTRSGAVTPDRTNASYPDAVTRSASARPTAAAGTSDAAASSERDLSPPADRPDGGTPSGTSAPPPASGDDAASRTAGPGSRPRPHGGDLVLSQLDDDPGTVPPFTPPPLSFTSGRPSGEVAGHGVGDGFKAGPGCSVQCITTGIAYARGVGAELVVETDTPARLWIIVWNDDGYHALRDAGDQLRTSFRSTFDDLEPGTSYQALAVAKDGAGFTSQRYGTFDTLRRFAQVDFGSFEVAVTNGEGPWAFNFRVDHLWHPQLREVEKHDPKLYPTLPGVRAVTIEDAPEYLDVMVQVVDNRTSTPTGFDSCGNVTDPIYDLLPDFGGSATTSCGLGYAWGTAFHSAFGIELDDRPSEETSWSGHRLVRQLSTSHSVMVQPVRFDAPVTIDVWYE
jgi:hypothetical protein